MAGLVKANIRRAVMKKTLWAAVALVAVVALVPAAAQVQQGPQRPGRAGMGRGFGPGGPGGPGPGIVHRLNLTDQQREQIAAIVEEHRESRPGAKVMDLRKELQAALFADTVDLAKVEGLKTAIAAAEAALLASRIETEMKVNQVLTPEQRAKARELIASAPGPRFGRGRGPGRF
jgi:Spy/CpxP family protein refolding chaperone